MKSKTVLIFCAHSAICSLACVGSSALVLGCSSEADSSAGRASVDDAPAGASERVAGPSAADENDDAAGASAGATPCQLPDGPRTYDESKNAEARALVQACVPSLTATQLSDAFEKIREDRGLRMSGQPDTPRRISWLYPENGCENRANEAAQLLERSGFPLPYFARATGELGLDTPNDVAGRVRWDGHVAPLVRVDDELLVLDPAIEPSRPLPIAEWLARMSLPNSHTEWAICQNFGLKENCYLGEPLTARPSGVENYFGYELRTQELLGRDPERSLGDCPPWRDCARPEPVANPDLPPTLRSITSNNVWWMQPGVGESIYVLGNNFIDGLTTVRVTGNGIDELVPTAKTLLRRLILPTGYAAGEYAVTAYNGALASETLTMTVE